jgi:hypothetical protein
MRFGSMGPVQGSPGRSKDILLKDFDLNFNNRSFWVNNLKVDKVVKRGRLSAASLLSGLIRRWNARFSDKLASFV